MQGFLPGDPRRFEAMDRVGCLFARRVVSGFCGCLIVVDRQIGFAFAQFMLGLSELLFERNVGFRERSDQFLLFMFRLADLHHEGIELRFDVGDFTFHPLFHRLPPQISRYQDDHSKNGHQDTCVLGVGGLQLNGSGCGR